MANYNSFLVTQKTFRVTDVAAFRKAIELLHTNIEIHEDGVRLGKLGGTIWIGGYDADLRAWDQDNNEVDIAELIQEHIDPSDYAVIQSVGYEKLRYVDGVVYVISKEKIFFENLDTVTERLVEQVKRDLILTEVKE